MGVILCLDCLKENDGYGFTVMSTATSIGGSGSWGSSTTYSCWPGYTHVSGDLQRNCLSSLIWEGRRPMCVPECDVTYPQSCKTCIAAVSFKPHCSIVNQTYITREVCRNQHALSPSYSVYFDGSVCLTSNCQFDIDGTSAQEVFSLTFSCSLRKYEDEVKQRRQHILLFVLTNFKIRSQKLTFYHCFFLI